MGKIFFFLLSVTTLLASNPFRYVTVRDYAQFLNVAAKEDPHSLYDQKMREESGIAAIERVGEPGNYSYYFYEQGAEEAVKFVDLRSAMRFCNWKENGELNDPSTTEYGVYELEGECLLAVHIDEKTRYFLPEENDDIASQESPCLKLGSLEDPASWLRSNQVVCHLKGRLENMAAVLTQETATSSFWKEDAKYAAGTIAVIATAALAWKYRDRCCHPRRAEHEQIDDESLDEDETRSNVCSLEGENEIDPNSGFQLQVQASTATAAATALEPREKHFHDEVQTFINQEIYPRIKIQEALVPDQMDLPNLYQGTGDAVRAVRGVRTQGPTFRQFFIKNFENIFEYERKTRELLEVVGPYEKKLRERNSDHRLLVQAHDAIKAEARKYRDDFDSSWKEALRVTQLQHHFLKEFQIKKEWVDGFLNLVDEEQEKIEHILEKGRLGENDSSPRIKAVKKAFEKEGRGQFRDNLKTIEKLVQKTQEKFSTWYQHWEKIFYGGHKLSVEDAEQVLQIVQLLDKKTKKLLDAYNTWKDEANNVISKAHEQYDRIEQRYTALYHVLSRFEEGVTPITETERDLVKRALNDYNRWVKIELNIPEEAAQALLEAHLQEQWNAIKFALERQRSIFDYESGIASVRGTLTENEKKILHWYLNCLDASSVNVVREKAVALRKELDSVGK